MIQIVSIISVGFTVKLQNRLTSSGTNLKALKSELLAYLQCEESYAEINAYLTISFEYLYYGIFLIFEHYFT